MVSHTYKYGSDPSFPTLIPSIKNSTSATSTLSVDSTVKSTVPEIVCPDIGLDITIIGGVVSSSGRLSTITVIGGTSDVLPEISVITIPILWFISSVSSVVSHSYWNGSDPSNVTGELLIRISTVATLMLSVAEIVIVSIPDTACPA